MEMIYRDDLTTAELKKIERIYGGYHQRAEFWTGFIDYQETGEEPSSEADQTRFYGAAAAMRIIDDRELEALAKELEMPPLETMRSRMSIYDMDDIASLHMIRGLRELAKEKPDKQ